VAADVVAIILAKMVADMMTTNADVDAALIFAL